MVHRDIFHYWIDVNLDEEKVQMVHGFIATGLEELKKTEDYRLYKIIVSDAMPMGGSTDGDQTVPTNGYFREVYVSKQTYMYRHSGL